MRLLCVGDTHGSTGFLRAMFDIAKDMECDRVFVLGDFGFYPKFEAGRKFLNYVSQMCRSYGIPLFWLDGNHEDFDTLEDVYGGLSLTNRFIEVRPRIFYSPRGHVFEWDGVKFMTVGGAYSINRSYMKLGVDWFKEEELTLKEERRIISNSQHVDVMFTHDAPTRSNVLDYTPSRKVIESAKMNRRILDHIVDVYQPKLLVHGHYHVPYREMHGGLKIIGLAHNGWPLTHQQDCWWIVDTEDFK